MLCNSIHSCRLDLEPDGSGYKRSGNLVLESWRLGCACLTIAGVLRVIRKLFLSYLPSAVRSLARIELELEIVNSDGCGVLGTNWGRIFLVEQGIPIPGAGPDVRGIVGPVRAKGVQAGVAAAYNALVGVGQEALELGINASGKVASVAAPLASTTLQAVASAVAWGKFAYDVGSFTYGATLVCQ
jgi:hypothetical protein